jgi:hypothetical protein
MRVLSDEQPESPIEICCPVDVRRANHHKVQFRRRSIHRGIEGCRCRLGERLSAGTAVAAESVGSRVEVEV